MRNFKVPLSRAILDQMFRELYDPAKNVAVCCCSFFDFDAAYVLHEFEVVLFLRWSMTGMVGLGLLA